MSTTTENINTEKYEKLIREKSRDISNVYWFSQQAIEDLPESLKTKFFEVIENKLSDGAECSVLSYKSIYHLWDVFVGKSLSEFAAAYYKQDDYKTSKYQVNDFLSYIEGVRDDLIDTCGSNTECDDYEYCAYSGEILSSFGRSTEMIKEEIKCISEQSELSQRDYDFIDLVFANHDVEIFEPLYHLFDKDLTKKRLN